MNDVDPTQDFAAATGAQIQPEVLAPEAAATESAPVTSAASAVEVTKGAASIKQDQKKSIQVQANARGLLVGGSLDEQFRLATAYCQSGLMPRGMDTPQKVLVGMQLCLELNLPVITSIGKVMVMNGTATIHSDLPLALVRRSGQLRSIKEEWAYDKDGAISGAKCTVWRKGADTPIVREFTISDAKIAQLWGKTSKSGQPSPWVLYPPRMLQMRARSWALKDEFGDILFGVGILEYDHNAIVMNGQVVGGDQQPDSSLSSELNSEYLDAKEVHSEAGTG